MVKWINVCSKLLVLFVFAVVSFYLPTGKVDAALSSWDKKTYVYDVKTSGLNIRSGAGTSYPIIGQVSNGTDIVEYCPSGACGVTTSDGFAWIRNYYPDGSIGYYANAALGWAAWYNTTGSKTFNYYYTAVAKTSRPTPMYSNDCSNMSNLVKGLSENYYLQSYDAELRASTCNPNAWRLQDHQAGSNSSGNFDSGYVNGWNLKAE
ncbi:MULTISPECIES: SH3 domain-containing protein [unclassified Paenibacillus]|uniref:SH3 domain-containing protein n=1 Tax=unclassified Paenibacillus TaxID=185978 RepID=UPI0009A7C69D|nr:MULTISPECIES: SH3 domain-containing protein [unclassified Paenibacillus]SLK16601.1 SH3 domain-containing protein [Paenibacillus sp. RU5A]SOC74415.1 SH3 domain-containing protein [Paenibacillus sp. RU26A]SOC76578.1 SH3 domain-containing protein [Paenibacillus sp. RU5M]